MEGDTLHLLPTCKGLWRLPLKVEPGGNTGALFSAPLASLVAHRGFKFLGRQALGAPIIRKHSQHPSLSIPYPAWPEAQWAPGR